MNYQTKLIQITSEYIARNPTDREAINALSSLAGQRKPYTRRAIVGTPLSERKYKIGNNKHQPWTIEQDKYIFQLRTEGKSWGHIAKALGRTTRATRQRWYSVKKRGGV